MILSGSRIEIEQQAATMISRAIEHAINKNNQAIMAVVGGRSIGGLLGALGRERLDWQKVHLFLADERLVTTDHPDSNFRLIRPHVETFIPRENLHPFRHAQADEIKSLQNYQQELSDCGGGFDISLLSSGEDGHVASLFPDHHTIRAADDSFLLTHSAPKPPPGRMSASRALLAGSSLPWYSSTGKVNAGLSQPFWTHRFRWNSVLPNWCLPSPNTTRLETGANESCKSNLN